jgi:hypothetical protein
MLHIASIMEVSSFLAFLVLLPTAVFASIVNAFEPIWHAPRSVPAVTVRTRRESSKDLLCYYFVRMRKIILLTEDLPH